jgi:NADH dehydrogenase FAD-containing subunit
MSAGPARQLLLLGAGPGRLGHLRQLYSGMVPGFVAGHYALEDCVIPLEPLVRRSGIRWLQRSVVALDAGQQTVQLDDGRLLHYDWLSLNTGPVQDRAQLERSLPGAREHALFLRPIEAFAGLWPQVLALGQSRALRIAVIGAGAAGMELAMAMRQRLPHAAITLLCGDAPLGSGYAPGVQKRLKAALLTRRITLLPDSAAGLRACDVPLLATGTQAPGWLQGSGLGLDAQGFVAVDACQRSTSHPQVFAAGDVCARVDRALARSCVYAVRAGPVLARNLAAAMVGRALRDHQPPQLTLNLLSCGTGYAIASWGRYSAQGRWVWWLKDWIDRRFVRRYGRRFD